MPIKRIKEAYSKRRKLTYKELEWDYLPMIVLFAVVAGILTLLLILLTIYRDTLTQEERNNVKIFRSIDNFLNSQESEEVEESQLVDDEFYVE